MNSHWKRYLSIAYLAFLSEHLDGADIRWSKTTTTASIGYSEGYYDRTVELYENGSSVCQELRRRLPGRSLIYSAITTEPKYRISGPREFDAGKYATWRARYDAEGARVVRRSVLEVLVTASGCRLRHYVNGSRSERILNLGALPDEFDQFLLRSVVWVWVFPGSQGTKAEVAKVFVKTPQPITSSQYRPGAFGIDRIKIVARQDSCFGIDIYFPWHHPFLEGVDECPSEEREVPVGQVCDMSENALHCR